MSASLVVFWDDTLWNEVDKADPAEDLSTCDCMAEKAAAKARLGALASFGARRRPGTKHYYGTSGDSFAAVAESGPKVGARAVIAGGEDGYPDSRHFSDEAGRYATGNLRTVYFRREQLRGHTTRASSGRAR